MGLIKTQRRIVQAGKALLNSLVSSGVIAVRSRLSIVSEVRLSIVFKLAPVIGFPPKTKTFRFR